MCSNRVAHSSLNVQTIWLVLLGTVSIFAQSAAANYACTELRSGDVDEALAYLHRGRSALADECIVQALVRVPATPKQDLGVLFEYLDFKRPLTDAERKGIYIRPMITAELFPAVAKLSEIGESAVPQLIKFIGACDENTDRYSNAIETLMLIYSSKRYVAVKTLADASRSSPDVLTGTRLFRAAQIAVEKCSPSIRSACVAALRDNPGQ